MKQFLLFLIASIPFFASSQRLNLDIYGGVANYMGDLQGKVFTFQNAGPSAGAGLTYDLSNRFMIRSALSFAQIQGNDKDNTKGKGVAERNLSFKSNIFEGHIALEFNLLDLTERSITPYVFAGAGIYRYNPFTFDNAGNKVFLHPLTTEGQGLPQYPDKKPYKLTGLAIPFGGGIKLAINDNLQIGLELGFRKLFTDYLDDVSTSYADSAILAAARGPKAAAIAYRGDELSGALTYPQEGAQRGNPAMNDWYYMSGLRVHYRLNGNGGGKSGGKNKTGCPGNVY